MVVNGEQKQMESEKTMEKLRMNARKGGKGKKRR